MNDATPATLQAWLDAAWDRHDREPGDVLSGLLQRAPALPDDDTGADALFLAQHVALGHLGDAAQLSALLPLLPPHPRFMPRIEATRWALDAIAGRASQAAPLLVRCRGLDGAVMTLAHHHRVDEARALMRAPEAEVLASDDADVRRAFASAANNIAGGLRDLAREPARDALMLEAAALARRAWERAGNWMNVERADWQAAMCHVAVGDGAGALRHAQACLARCEAEAADAYERFFGHQALAEAHQAAGDGAAMARHRAQMQALLAEVSEPAQRAYCEATLARTPRGAG